MSHTNDITQPDAFYDLIHETYAPDDILMFSETDDIDDASWYLTD